MEWVHINNKQIIQIIVLIIVAIFAYTLIQSDSPIENISSTSDSIDTNVPITPATVNAESNTKTQANAQNLNIDSCGNGVCEPELGEDYKNCGECPEYIVDDSNQITSPASSCGNGICEPELGEDYKNCGECPEYVVDDFNQIKSCGNGICEPELNEVVQNCPEDCQ